MNALYSVRVPAVLFHIDAAVREKLDTFLSQTSFLIIEVRGKTPGVIHDPVAGVIAVELRHAEYLPHQSGITLPPDETGNLTVRGDMPARDLFDNR